MDVHANFKRFEIYWCIEHCSPYIEHPHLHSQYVARVSQLLSIMNVYSGLYIVFCLPPSSLLSTNGILRKVHKSPSTDNVDKPSTPLSFPLYSLGFFKRDAEIEFPNFPNPEQSPFPSLSTKFYIIFFSHLYPDMKNVFVAYANAKRVR